MLIAREAEIERLRQIIKELQRRRFGRRAETLPEDQLLLGWKRPSNREFDIFGSGSFRCQEWSNFGSRLPRSEPRLS